METELLVVLFSFLMGLIIGATLMYLSHYSRITSKEKSQ